MATRTFSTAVLALLLLAPLHLANAEVAASFRYRLASFSGPVSSLWAKLDVDRERDEVYALNQRQNDIRIFDDHGMEIFVFGEDHSTAADIAIGRDGDIFILSTGYQSAAVHLLNYRGEHVAEIELKNAPSGFSEFVADRLLFRDESLYLVDSSALLVMVVDERGYFEKGYDLKTKLRPHVPRDDEVKGELRNTDRVVSDFEYVELGGIAVDAQGNIVFTIPVWFSAFRLRADGEMQHFGKAGSAPGKFGVASGVATDDAGYIYVSDRLRSVVLVFDPNLVFQTEFGYRGDRPSNLIVPDDLAIDSNGNLYVGQAANRGVSVFRVVHELIDDSQSSNSKVTTIASEGSVQAVEAIDLPSLVEFIADAVDGPEADLAETGRTHEENGSDVTDVMEDNQR